MSNFSIPSNIEPFAVFKTALSHKLVTRKGLSYLIVQPLLESPELQAKLFQEFDWALNSVLDAIIPAVAEFQVEDLIRKVPIHHEEFKGTPASGTLPAKLADAIIGGGESVIEDEDDGNREAFGGYSTKKHPNKRNK